jgi:transcription elongation GreA/GreB family factor
MITQLGYDHLLQNLQDLNQELARTSEERGKAAAEGDLKENSAYIFLGERAEVLRSQIRTVTDDIKQSVITPLPNQTRIIEFGHQIKLKFLTSLTDMTITLVGKNDASLKPGWISIDSPLGIALLRHSVGDKVSVNDQLVEIQDITIGSII